MPRHAQLVGRSSAGAIGNPFLSVIPAKAGIHSAAWPHNRGGILSLNAPARLPMDAGLRRHDGGGACSLNVPRGTEDTPARAFPPRHASESWHLGRRWSPPPETPASAGVTALREGCRGPEKPPPHPHHSAATTSASASSSGCDSRVSISFGTTCQKRSRQRSQSSRIAFDQRLSVLVACNAISALSRASQ